MVSSPTFPAVPASLSAIVRAMIPIVFCASFVPWLNAMNAAESTWALAEDLPDGRPTDPHEHPIDQHHQDEPHQEPAERRGVTSPMSALFVPSLSSAFSPPAANPAPSRPAMRAWDSLDGSPKYWAASAQSVAASTAAATVSSPTIVRIHDAFGDRLGDRSPDHESSDEVQHPGHQHRVMRSHHARGHDGRDRVRGVGPPVGELEQVGQEKDEPDHQAFFRAIASSMLETSSSWSMAPSVSSMTSRHFRTSIALYSPPKSPAMARR